MKRRDFFTSSSAALVGDTLFAPFDHTNLIRRKARTAKNIIFMVSDGMSTGTRYECHDHTCDTCGILYQQPVPGRRIGYRSPVS